MDKEEIFYEMMETVYEYARKISEYESIPRKYGTEDEIYMVEAHTINLVGDKNKTNVSELAELTNKTKGAISQMIERLIKKGMATKSRNPLDNREVIIELTDKGKIVYNFHKKLDQKEYRRLLKDLEEFTAEDFRRYIDISRILIKGIRL